MWLPGWIALVAFVVILTVLAITKRGEKSWLDKFPPLKNEEVLFVDDTAKFTSYFRGTPQIYGMYPGGHVVVTNKRILLAQKALFIKRFRLSFAINYVESGPVLTQQFFMGGGLFKDGKFMEQAHLDFYTSPDRIKFITEKGAQALEITIPFPDPGPLLAEPRFVISTKNIQAYKKIFK